MAFERILVDIDASAAAQPALDAAVAAARRSGARLRLVDVLTTPSGWGGRAVEARLTARCEQLANWSRRFPDVVEGTDVLFGPRVDALLEEVRRSRYDLVMRSLARERAERPAGRRGTGADLYGRCPCPIWTVGPAPMPSRPRIAAAIDVRDAGTSESAESVVQTALAFATLFNGSLTLVHAWQPRGELRVAFHAREDEHARFLARSRNAAMHALAGLADGCHHAGVTRRVEVRHGPAIDVVPEFVISEGIDLLVVGSGTRSGLTHRLPEHTVERLLDRMVCSLVAVSTAGPDAALVRSAPPPDWRRSGSDRA